MKVGGIYKWATHRAQGHPSRNKYHVYIGKDDKGKNVFMFINSENYYNEGFELTKAQYPFFTKDSSYIGCTSIVSYKDEEIAHISDSDCLGVLTKTHINGLAAHIGKSEILEKQHIKIICSSLSAAAAQPLS
jgi:hypothetical protein